MWTINLLFKSSVLHKFT